MKIRTQLIVAMLTAAMLPYIAVVLFACRSFNSASSDSILTFINKESNLCAEYINRFFMSLITEAKSLTSDDAVRFSLENSVAFDSDDWVEYPEVIQACNAALAAVETNNAICEVYMINTKGIVAASSNNYAVGTKSFDIAELDRIAAKHNGIGDIYLDEDTGKFRTTIVKRVFSSNNSKIGILYEIIDLSTVTDYIQLAADNGEISGFLIDCNGNYYETGSFSVRNMNQVKEFIDIAESIAPAAVYTGDGSTGLAQFKYSYDYTVKNAYAVKIETGEWSFMRVTPQKYLNQFVASPVKSIKIFAVVIAILVAALVVFFCAYFTAPISKIVNVINSKKHGDDTAKLDIKGNNEFGEISYALNSMFDSVFESEQRYRSVVSMNDNIIFEVNLKTDTVYVSNNFNRKFAFRAKDDSIGGSFLFKLKVFKDDAKRFNADVTSILTNGTKWEGEYRVMDAYGSFSWMRFKCKKYFDRNNMPSKVIGMIVDIDKVKKSEMKLVQKASYDALTQLYNRQTFMIALEDELRMSAARRSLDALFFIDLDDFKHFNDEYGHACGDEVLRFVADSIKEITFERGFGGRIGGDEFLFCLTELKLIGDAGNAAKELIETLDKGFESESTGITLNIHCSVGIAFFRENGNTPEELQEAADTAMYNIKKHGKSNFAYASSTTTGTAK